MPSDRIEFANVSFALPEGRLLLDGVSLNVEAGTTTALLGRSGSGKTTMIRTLLGLIPVDRGTGEVLGLDFSRKQLEIRRRVGFAPEDECLFPHVQGVEFVAYAGELVGGSKARIEGKEAPRAFAAAASVRSSEDALGSCRCMNI